MFKRFLFVIVLLVIFTSTSIHSQLAFGVKPGIGLNGAYFGLKLDNIVPFGSIDYIHAGGTFTESGQRFDYNLSQLVNFEDKDEASFSIYNISAGCKILFTKNDNLSAYITGVVSKPIITAESKNNGKTDASVSDFLDKLSLWGISAGFGAEYFVSDKFSVGGEFGLRVFLGSYQREFTETEYVMGTPPNYNWYPVETKRKQDISVNLSLTYSVVTLNYYF